MALLGQQIAELFDTAPDPDPENLFADDTLAKNENIDTGVDIELNPSRIRDLDLGEEYKGEVISRKQLNQWDNDAIDDDIDIDDEDEDDDDNAELRVIPVLDDDDEEEEEDDEDDDIEDIEEFDTLYEDENEETAGLIPGSMKKPKNKHSLDRFNDNDEYDEYNDFQSMMNKQMDEAEKLQNEQQQQNLQVISSSSSTKKPQSFQLRKAKSVAKQTKIYDKIASLRIHLQKTFQIAQKLPRPSVHCELVKVDGEQQKDGNDDDKLQRRRKLKRLFSEVSDKTLSITNNIMDLQSKLIDKNGDEYPEELRFRKKRRLNDSSSNESNIDFDNLWTEMNKDWNDFLPHSNKTMDLWDRKMRLVESFATYKEKKNQIGNQSLLERIALIIENPQRILHKMQSVDKLFRMYGDNQLNKNKNNNDVQDDDNDNDINKKDERIMAGLEDPTSLKFEKYRVECEVFNDAQFYRRMLKEIIDIGHASTFNHQEIHNKMDQIQQEKQKQKMAFHKAKLRMKYTIRPDMENFMAPRYNHDPDFPVEQLYNSLFQ